MKTRSLSSWKLQFAFAAASVTLLVVGAFSYRSFVVASESDQWVLHTQLVLRNLQGLLVDLAGIEASSRGFVLTGEDSYFEVYRAAKSTALQDAEEVRSLTVDNPEQQRRLAALDDLIARRIQFAETIVGVRRAQGLQAAADAIRAGEGLRISGELQTVLLGLENEELRLLEQRNADTRRQMGQIQITLIFGTVLGVLITAAAGWLVLRDTTRRRLAETALRESEEQYRMLVYEVQDYAFYMLDLQGRVITWNAGAERIKGYSANEIIGRNYSCFFPPDEIKRGRPEEILRLTAASGRLEEQGRRVRKDGSQFLASFTLTTLRDSAGNLRGFTEVSHDLSESKESGAKYRGLLEAAPDAMVVVNQGGEIVLLNVQAEKQFGYRRDELLGQKVTNIIPEGFAERLIANGTRTAEDALAQQIGTGIELSGRRSDGSEFPIEIMLSPLDSPEGILVIVSALRMSQPAIRLPQISIAGLTYSVALMTSSKERRSPLRSDLNTKASSPSTRGWSTFPHATSAPSSRIMSANRTPKSGSSTPSCACTALDVSPIFWPAIVLPRLSQTSTLACCTA
jgi:PAS domain S-box-containing protein